MGRLNDAVAISKKYASQDLVSTLTKQKEELEVLVQLFKDAKSGILDLSLQGNKDLFDSIKISEEGAQKILEQTNKKLKEAQENTTELEKKLRQELVKGVEDGVGKMGDAFVDFAVKGKASFKDLTASILSDIAKILVRAQLLRALQAFAPGFFGTTTPAAPAGGGTTLATGSAKLLGSPSATNLPTFTSSRSNSIFSDAGFANAVNSIGSRSAGGATTVNVINNTNGETEVKETNNADGSRSITIMIEEKIKETIATGRLDELMAGNFGVSRRGY